MLIGRRGRWPQLMRRSLGHILGASSMRRTVHTILTLFATAFLVSGTSTLPLSSSWKVKLRSFGPVDYGMTLRDASRTLRESLALDSTETFEKCSYVKPQSAPAGTGFMVIDSIIVRVDVDTTGISTASGAHVGSTEAQIRALYPGRIRSEPHPYDGPEWHYLIYTPKTKADSKFGMIFETDGHRVRSFRAGLHPYVDAIEGCA
jgi:hypothetical protein